MYRVSNRGDALPKASDGSRGCRMKKSPPAEGYTSRGRCTRVERLSALTKSINKLAYSVRVGKLKRSEFRQVQNVIVKTRNMLKRASAFTKPCLRGVGHEDLPRLVTPARENLCREVSSVYTDGTFRVHVAGVFCPTYASFRKAYTGVQSVKFCVFRDRWFNYSVSSVKGPLLAGLSSLLSSSLTRLASTRKRRALREYVRESKKKTRFVKGSPDEVQVMQDHTLYRPPFSYNANGGGFYTRGPNAAGISGSHVDTLREFCSTVPDNLYNFVPCPPSLLPLLMLDPLVRDARLVYSTLVPPSTRVHVVDYGTLGELKVLPSLRMFNQIIPSSGFDSSDAPFYDNVASLVKYKPLTSHHHDSGPGVDRASTQSPEAEDGCVEADSGTAPAQQQILTAEDIAAMMGSCGSDSGSDVSVAVRAIPPLGTSDVPDTSRPDEPGAHGASQTLTADDLAAIMDFTDSDDDSDVEVVVKVIEAPGIPSGTMYLSGSSPFD